MAVYISNLKLSNNLILAPMSGVGDAAFRVLCRKYGAGLVCGEFVSAEGIVRQNPKSILMTSTVEEERPVSIQLFGNKLETIAKAAKYIEARADIVDFNMGCPADKITRIACGSALLKNPKRIGEIVKTIKNAVKCPITVKIRLGIDDSSINVLKIAKIIEENGADSITVHARTMKQGYSGTADWEKIREVKELANIPITANGDIIDGVSAKKCLQQTKADFLMIGRGAMKNPHIFNEITHYLETGEELKLSLQKKLSIVLEYISLAQKYKIDFPQALRHSNAMSKCLPSSTKLRFEMNKTKSFEELNAFLAVEFANLK